MYLSDKPVVEVYQWVPRVRRIYCWNCGEEGHLARDCWDDFDEDDCDAEYDF